MSIGGKGWHTPFIHSRVDKSWICYCSLPPATKLGQGNIFRSVCQEFCPWGTCMAWGVCMAGGACVVGGMHGRGACVAGVCVWLGACMPGGNAWQLGVHGRGACMVGGMHGRGACMVGGHVWQGACKVGGMHCRGSAWHTVNERAVRILLECILVRIKFWFKFFWF